MSKTRLLVTTVMVILGIYDGCAVMWGGVDMSISRLFNSLAPYPGFVFVVGYLCGHFFGWMTPTMPAGKRAELLKIANDMMSNPASCSSNGRLVYCHNDWAKKLLEIAGQ